MRAVALVGVVLVSVLSSIGCDVAPASAARPGPSAKAAEPADLPLPSAREVRATGKIRAVKEFSVLTPQIAGQSSRLTLVGLVPTGTQVKAGDILAEFDRTQQLDNARDAQAQFDDLGHQVDQKRAENRSNSEKRGEELQQAKADFAKARLQIRLGPILAEVERLKAEARMEDAQLHLASLQKSHKAHEVEDAAALRILELKQARQKVALERALRNADRLLVKAPLAGMVALENTWRNGSMGAPQEGDPMFPGQPLLRIFDPSTMDVVTLVGEPDGAVLVPGARADVYLDSYPERVFGAHLESASPVASGAIGSPIKRFMARFRMDGSDPHLLPDLAAAVVIRGENEVSKAGGRP